MHLLCLNSCNPLLCFMHVLFVDLILLMLVAPDTRTAGNSLVDGSRQVSKDYLKPPPIGYKIVLPSPSKTIIVFYWSRVKVLLWVSS